MILTALMRATFGPAAPACWGHCSVCANGRCGYFVENARSSRSICKGCGIKIYEDVLRILTLAACHGSQSTPLRRNADTTEPSAGRRTWCAGGILLASGSKRPWANTE